jgi:hypothetical protein
MILCSNHYGTDSRHKSFLLRFWPSIALHFIVSGGLGLVVVGLLSNSSNGKDLSQAGYIVLLIVGLIVAGLVALSWRCAHNNAASKRVSDPSPTTVSNNAPRLPQKTVKLTLMFPKVADCCHPRLTVPDHSYPLLHHLRF